jgi:hypothetical protein
LSSTSFFGASAIRSASSNPVSSCTHVHTHTHTRTHTPSAQCGEGSAYA